jgi:hypothetical protein
LAQNPGGRCSAQQSPLIPNRWYLDFDKACPSGKGGAGILVDPVLGLASIDGVHRNDLLPRRSTGGLLAEGLVLVGMPQPSILEAYNVDKSTFAALIAGGDGHGTLLGNLLSDTVTALGGSITRWDPVPDGGTYHLRVQVTYP